MAQSISCSKFHTYLTHESRPQEELIFWSFLEVSSWRQKKEPCSFLSWRKERTQAPNIPDSAAGWSVPCTWGWISPSTEGFALWNENHSEDILIYHKNDPYETTSICAGTALVLLFVDQWVGVFFSLEMCSDIQNIVSSVPLFWKKPMEYSTNCTKDEAQSN